jgi:hypothetical protein
MIEHFSDPAQWHQPLEAWIADLPDTASVGTACNGATCPVARCIHATCFGHDPTVTLCVCPEFISIQRGTALGEEIVPAPQLAALIIAIDALPETEDAFTVTAGHLRELITRIRTEEVA